jgi:hypothetical protein
MKIRLFGAVLGIEENKEISCPNIKIVLGIGKVKVILCTTEVYRISTG